jgi:hypothetical protein
MAPHTSGIFQYFFVADPSLAEQLSKKQLLQVMVNIS